MGVQLFRTCPASPPPETSLRPLSSSVTRRGNQRTDRYARRGALLRRGTPHRRTSSTRRNECVYAALLLSTPTARDLNKSATLPRSPSVFLDSSSCPPGPRERGSTSLSVDTLRSHVVRSAGSRGIRDRNSAIAKHDRTSVRPGSFVPRANVNCIYSKR